MIQKKDKTTDKCLSYDMLICKESNIKADRSFVQSDHRFPEKNLHLHAKNCWNLLNGGKPHKNFTGSY